MAVLAAGVLLAAGGYTATAQVEPAGVLAVSPAGGFSCSGLASEISGSTKTYTLTNIGTAPLDWMAAWNTKGDGRYWALSTPAGSVVDGQGGTLAAGEIVAVTVRVSGLPPYDGLNDPGTAHTTLAFTNVTNGLGSATRYLQITRKRPATLQFPGPSLATLLWIRGDTALRVACPEWSWENPGNYYLSSSVQVDQPWLTLDYHISHPCCGCGWASVTGNAVTNTLAIGSHEAAISFSFSGYGLPAEDQHRSAAVTLRLLWPGDINADFTVDAVDMLCFAASWTRSINQPGYSSWCDINYDGTVDAFDLMVLVANWGEGLE